MRATSRRKTKLPPTATPFEADLTSTAVANTGIQLGSTVRIGNTDGTGLAVRQGPGVTYTYFVTWVNLLRQESVASEEVVLELR